MTLVAKLEVPSLMSVENCGRSNDAEEGIGNQ